jgi:hypothetical protein
MRRRVSKYLAQKGHRDGGPTLFCLALFWFVFICWTSSYIYLCQYGTVFGAFMLGMTGSFLGAFGHNWVHIPKYKFYAYLSLDTIGFSSDGWFREHNL